MNARVVWLLGIIVLLAGLTGYLVTRRPAAAPTAGVGATTSRATAAPASGRSPLRLASGVEAEPTGGPDSPFVLEGRVLSTEDGAGVDGALLSLSNGSVVSEARSGGDGSFRWTTTTSDRFHLVSLEAPGHVSFAPGLGLSTIVFVARPGRALREVTLYLTPEAPRGDLGGRDGGAAPATAAARDAGAGAATGRVVGRVRDEAGKMVASISIVARVKKGAMERGAERQGSFFDPEGSFALEVEAGTQCVAAFALGKAAAPEQCVEVRAGQDTTLDFKLGKGAKLSGRVTDRASRGPIARASVSLEQPFGDDEASPLPVIASTTTDASGRFELSGLDSGVRSIYVTAQGHHSRVVPGMKLDPENPPPAIEIDLLATEPGEKPSIESAGINAAVRGEGDKLVIVGTAPGGGAAEAGMQGGDVVLRVDGVEVKSLGLQSAVERLRGPEGSTVLLVYQRPPADALIEVRVTRKRLVFR